jgi:hypothetical protein
MASDKQIAANQANAIKSTGPKSAQGKATASRNALKHGMTCEKEDLFSSDAKLYKDRLASWTKAARPQNDLEVFQLECAVRAAVNLDRCARNADAALDRRKRKVVGDWDGVQTKKVNATTEHWTSQPAVCVALLETFSRGVEWLLDCWEDLAKTLETNEFWTIADACRAIRLMGKSPETLQGDDELAAFRVFVVATLPEIDLDEVEAFLGVDTSHLTPEARVAQLREKLPTPEDALEGLWAAFNAELERLTAIRANLRESTDGPALAKKIDLVSFDGSKKGVLRRRYESANHMDMHRCLKQLTEQQRLREIRVEEDREIAEKARAAQWDKEQFQMEKRRRERLRNEAKPSAATGSHVSTSDKSEVKRPRDFADPGEYVKYVLGQKEPATEVPPPSSPAAPGAGEAQKPS